MPQTAEQRARRMYTKQCIDCGKSCTSTRCRRCASLERRVDIPHGTWNRYAKGCRCIACGRAAKDYNLERSGATCIQCGHRWQLEPGQPQKHDRCRTCRRAPANRCACGAQIAKDSKRCLTCYRAEQAAGYANQPRRCPPMKRLPEIELGDLMRLFLMLNHLEILHH